MSKFKLTTFAVTACMLVASGTASAAGGALTGGATEFTQILNNGELIAQLRQQIAAVNQLAQSYVVQYNQLREQILANTKISGLSISDVVKMKNDMEAYQKSLKTLGRDLGGLEQMFDSRLVEAKLKNMPFSDYLASEQAKVNSNNQAAKARLARERAMAQQVQNDIVQVKEYGRRVDSTVGVHESTQLLNGQMNLMLQQMTRLVSMTAEAQGSDKAQEMNSEAAAREVFRARAEAQQRAEEDMRNRSDAALNRMRTYKAPVAPSP